MHIWWVPSRKKNVLFLSPKTLQNLKIISEKITLHLGFWKHTLEVRPLDALEENTIGIPDLLAKPLTIPDTLPYDVHVDGDDLFLGPVIAVVVRRGKLSQQRLRFWTDYCRNYSDIRGLIFFCMVPGIDIKTKTIKGYYFDPNANDTEQWKPGTFPYPGVVYQRTDIPREILTDLKKSTDGKVFNAYLFNKWEMWRVLYQAGFTNTPHTAMFGSLDSLKKMLGQYQSVYLKPAKGRFGVGIQRVEKVPDGYLLKREYGSNRCANLGQVFKLIKKYKKNRRYIIQQSVPLIFRGKMVDFRVILQKDASRKWACSGIIAKFGYEGWIYTNTASEIHLASEALQMALGLTPEQAVEKEMEIKKICTEACQIIEGAYGIFGDVGIDVTVDKDHNIWVLEINKLHQHLMVKRKYPDMYHRVITRPLEYAKSLAGFK